MPIVNKNPQPSKPTATPSVTPATPNPNVSATPLCDDSEKCATCHIGPSGNKVCCGWHSAPGATRIFTAEISISDETPRIVFPFIADGKDIVVRIFDDHGRCVSKKSLPVPTDGSQYDGDKS